MNQIIKEQLTKCSVAKIPVIDDNTTHFIVPMKKKSDITKYQINKCYILELSDSFLTLPKNSTIVCNWNGGMIPKHKYYKCAIVKVMNNMIKITGFGVDLVKNIETMDMWEGWVPNEDITIVQELE